MASQSSTSHGFNSSGILILISTLLKNCSSVSTELSMRRFLRLPNSKRRSKYLINCLLNDWISCMLKNWMEYLLWCIVFWIGFGGGLGNNRLFVGFCRHWCRWRWFGWTSARWNRWYIKGRCGGSFIIFQKLFRWCWCTRITVLTIWTGTIGFLWLRCGNRCTHTHKKKITSFEYGFCFSDLKN